MLCFWVLVSFAWRKSDWKSQAKCDATRCTTHIWKNSLWNGLLRYLSICAFLQKKRVFISFFMLFVWWITVHRVEMPWKYQLFGALEAPRSHFDYGFYISKRLSLFLCFSGGACLDLVVEKKTSLFTVKNGPPWNCTFKGGTLGSSSRTRWRLRLQEASKGVFWWSHFRYGFFEG